MRAHGLTAIACIALTLLRPAPAQVEETDTGAAADASSLSDPQPQASEPPPEEVLVTGERPGPGLWKVSKDGHTLWILGTYAPLPKEMTWRSADAEALIAASQEFLTPGGIRQDIDVGFFQAVTLFPSMIRAGKIPNGGKLQDILAPEVYEKWQVLQRKYMPHETAETMRPSFAAQSLHNSAFVRSGLGGDAGVWDALRKAARKHRVKIMALPSRKVELKVKGGRSILKEFSQTPLVGADCLTTTVNQLESDFELLRTRANAWATGNVSLLRELLDRKLTPECAVQLAEALLAGGFGKESGMDARMKKFSEDVQAASQVAAREWLEATESALARNVSTFAVMPIGWLLKPDSYVSELRARGYAVEEPG